jgi:hypothetical protein
MICAKTKFYAFCNTTSVGLSEICTHQGETAPFLNLEKPHKLAFHKESGPLHRYDPSGSGVHPYFLISFQANIG